MPAATNCPNGTGEVRDQPAPLGLFHTSIENNKVGLMQFKIQCQANNVDIKQSLLCYEHIGIYSQALLNFVSQHNFSLWLESSMRIKRSMGLQRGKSVQRSVKSRCHTYQ